MSSSETMTRQEDTSLPWTLRDQTEPGTKSRSWCARSQSTRRKEDVRIAHVEAYANRPMTDDDLQKVSSRRQQQSTRSQIMRPDQPHLETLPL
jgi:hypothetical protein